MLFRDKISFSILMIGINSFFLGASNTYAFDVAWSGKAGEHFAQTPKFYPATSNPTNLVAVTEEGIVSFWDANGTCCWSKSLGGKCMAPPGIGDVDGNNVAEIIIGLLDGSIVLLNPDGTECWRNKMPGRISTYRCPALADLNEKDGCEIILTDDQGYVACFAGDGQRLWRFRIDSYYASPVGIGDLDGDAEPEIVYGTENNRVVCLSANGRLKWVREIEGKFGRTAPSLGDLNGDGYPDIVVTTSFNTPTPKMIALSGPDGEILWKSPIQMWAYASNVIADLDRDGTPEVICSGRGRRIHVFNADGTLRWKKILESGGYYYESVVADIDNDKAYELINGSRTAPGIEILNADGGGLESYGKNDCHITPLVGDLDGDNLLELIVTQKNTGTLVCYDLKTPAQPGSVLWPTYRYDSANTGKIKQNLQPAAPIYRQSKTSELKVKIRKPYVCGVNRAEIDWPEALPERFLLEIAVQPEKQPAEINVLTITRTELPQFVEFNLSHAKKHRIEFSLCDCQTGQSIAKCTLKIKNQGVKTLVKWCETKNRLLDEIANTLESKSPNAALFLRETAAKREASLSAIRATIANIRRLSDQQYDRLNQDVARLRQKIIDDLTLAETLKDIAQHTSIPSVLVWPDPNPWDDRSYLDGLASLVPEKGAELNIWMLKNETEDAALNLLNLTPNPITVLIRPQDNAPDFLEFRELIETPRDDGNWARDALPRLNEAGTIELCPGEIRQLWVVCNSNSLAPGTHKANIQFLAIGHKDELQKATVSLDVDEIDLTSGEPFMRCNWSSPSRLRGRGYDISLIRPAIESGMNIMTGLSLPIRKCDEQGQLIGVADWSIADQDLAVLTEECFLLFSLNIKAPESVQEGDSIWCKALRSWADEVAAHLESKGFPLSKWAVYPVDEPGLYDGPRIEMTLQKAKNIKKAAPYVQVYANPSGEVREDNFRPLLPYIDVWCPELGMLMRRPHMADFFLSDNDAPVWTYEAPSRVKFLRPLGYYRSQPLIAFTFGLSGAGYWTHFYNDIWLNLEDEEYGMAYMTNDALVDSRRWHATRDGTEDARLYLLLRNLINKARKSGLKPYICGQAASLIENDLKAALQKPMAADDVTRHVIEYDPDLAEFQSLRKRAALLIKNLQ